MVAAFNQLTGAWSLGQATGSVTNFIQSGNPDLRFENGRSFGYGLTWSPSEHLTLTADYWNIRIDNLVTTLDYDTLARHCRAHLAAFKVPKQLILREQLPRNPSGKVLKRVLRDELR